MKVLFAVIFSFALLAQEALTNEGVLKLVKAGMSEDLVVNAINDQTVDFNLGADQLVLLKDGGVSERIIRAMMAKTKGSPVAGVGAAATPGTGGKLSVESLKQGVHYKKEQEYFELLTEEIAWKTTGAFKSYASLGIVNKDLKGNLSGPSSRNFLKNPMEIVLVPPPGLTVNSFVLLPMKSAGKGEREFLVGPVNSKSGVAKGAIGFGVEKVGTNQFRMVLQTPLGPGEYGILPVTPSAAGPSTKMYTFRVTI